MRPSILFLAFALATSAAIGQDGASQLAMKQWVSPSAEGRIDVAIVAPGLEANTLAPEQFHVSLVSQDGAVYRAEPSANSPVELSFVGVPAGVYSLVMKGPETIACYAIHVVETPEKEVDPSRHQLLIGAANMRLNKVRGAVVRYLGSSVPFVAEVDDAAGIAMLESLSLSQSMRVTQTAGSMSGRIYRAGLDGQSMIGAGLTNVLIYQNRELIAQAVTDEDGGFVVQSLAPGPYGLIAIGPEGFAVLGFSLAEELVARASSNPVGVGKLVAFQGAGTQPELDVQLAPAGSESPAIEELLDDQGETQPPTEPGLPVDGSATAGAPGSGGGYSGGGGGGGGAGAGGLLGLAGVGAAIAASSSDDDNNFTTPPVTSPITP